MRRSGLVRWALVAVMPLVLMVGGAWSESAGSDTPITASWAEYISATRLSSDVLTDPEGDEDSDRGRSFAEAASDSIGPFLILGELSLFMDGENGKDEAETGAKTVLATYAVTEALKAVVREKRPDSDSRDSFPSGHTALAFAMAAVLAEYQPDCGIPAYSVAATIGWSRVDTNKHYWQDVIAGAALGYCVARYFVDEDAADSSPGLALRWEW